MKKIFVLITFLSLIIVYSADAQFQKKGRKPPFVQACISSGSTLAIGTKCSFTDRRTKTQIEGTCQNKTNPMGNEEVVCYNEAFFKEMASHKPGNKPGRGPDKESIQDDK